MIFHRMSAEIQKTVDLCDNRDKMSSCESYSYQNARLIAERGGWKSADLGRAEAARQYAKATQRRAWQHVKLFLFSDLHAKRSEFPPLAGVNAATGRAWQDEESARYRQLAAAQRARAGRARQRQAASQKSRGE